MTAPVGITTPRTTNGSKQQEEYLSVSMPTTSSWLGRSFSAVQLNRDDLARHMKYELALTHYKKCIQDGGLLQGILTTENDPRSKYKEFLAAWKDLIRDELHKGPNYRDPTVIKLCRARYFELHMFPYLKQLVQRMAQSGAHGSLPSFNPDNVALTLQEFADALQGSSDTKHGLTWLKDKLCSATMGGDHTTKNIPNLRCVYRFKSGESTFAVPYARHPAPVIENGIRGGSIQIAPDYKLAVSGRTTLACVHLNPEKDSLQRELQGIEAIRTFTETTPGFSAIGQPMDGPFFNQEEGWETITEFSLLKSTISHHIRKEKCGLWLSSDLKGDGWKKRVETILDEVHSLFFEKKANLEKGDWTLFILFFYIMHSTHVMCEKNVDGFSAFCRLSCGRGGVRGFVHDLVLSKMMGQSLSEDAIFNLFGTAIMANREVVPADRLQLAIAAGKHLQHLDGKPFEAYKFPGEWKPSDIVVEKPEGQEIPAEHAPEML